MRFLKKGDTGEDVKKLQGILGLKTDGIFGDKTRDAVINYQLYYELEPNGYVDNQVWALLLSKGGKIERVDLDTDLPAIETSDDLIALDEALTKFSEKDKIKADLVKLRFFAGLTGHQAAQVLGISQNTADRYWAYARSWLHLEITKDDQTNRD